MRGHLDLKLKDLYLTAFLGVFAATLNVPTLTIILLSTIAWYNERFMY
jgi:hypothetical protein